MPYKDNTVSLGGYVERRNPIRMNLDAFAQAINKIDERREKTYQQVNAIRNAIGNIKLNAAEDEWKAKYMSDIEAKINSAAMFGDMSQAYNTAMDLAGKVASDPALLGRVRNNEAITAYKETLQKKVDAGLVSSDVAKAWELDNANTFKSTDVYDSTGVVTGVNEWKPKWKPVNYVDSPTKIQEVFKGITPEKGGSNWNTGRYDTKETTQSGGSNNFERSTKERFIPVLKERFIEDDAWRNYIIQEQMSASILLEDVNKQIENEKDPIKLKALNATKKLYEQKATDDDGKIITDPFEFLQHKYKDTINSLPYNWKTTSSNDVRSPITKSEDKPKKKRLLIFGDLDNPYGELGE